MFILRKNGGTCFDNDGTEKFSCICIDVFTGETCQTNLCDDIECPQSETCVSAIVDGEKTAKCECPFTIVEDICLDLCNDIECENGICIDGVCQCDTGYVNIDNTCEQTCDVDLCQVRVKPSYFYFLVKL